VTNAIAAVSHHKLDDTFGFTGICAAYGTFYRYPRGRVIAGFSQASKSICAYDRHQSGDTWYLHVRYSDGVSVAFQPFSIVE
jgi:hypothetical protein